MWNIIYVKTNLLRFKIILIYNKMDKFGKGAFYHVFNLIS